MKDKNKVVSSILERTNAEPLTLDLLKANIPAVKEGKEAAEALKTEKDPQKRAELQKLKLAGTKAQETLIVSALPLIKSVAHKEHQRRSAWSSRIAYDDILQEAIAGFIRGLYAFRLDIEIKSPTNYLGQWIMTSIRRQIETMDHDFSIPHETIERHRRMRAIFSRLATELKRDPTDEEFLKALNSSDFAADTSKWGRINKTPAKNDKPRYTQKHIDEMRETANKTYALASITPVDTESDNEYEVAGENITFTQANLNTVEEAEMSASQTTFFYKVFQTMRMGSTQQDIIARTFGLAPYNDVQTPKEISEDTAVTQKFVKQVIQAFSTYMPVKGGVFHEVLTQLSEDEVDSLEFGWLLPIVGEWTKTTVKVPAPEILTKISR